ncbi:hypothetical protein GCM10011376_22540 [Nocardioides flavus (ex Wang et al. 2016)]|uniref:VCBS repeat-containing protein n=1 Tax=Nocardioides flavus (ex Wang et al. 2016) TaxID=2058780 RepID=A0ABQ3HNE4_9ACTN|nr:hypothetical protein [Nocardioides flavus (ex Wang et al. 2016)]GHE17644.1 hypothetical protein GCM10011376_22540 [Nocardioides flavus (ex Wang et al. 2016)]
MNPHHPATGLDERLRAALAARADLVRPEDLAPLAPVVPLRPRWRTPLLLLAAAAAVLLVLGLVLDGLGRDPRSDDVAPSPDDRVELELPADVGRDWEADEYSTPARLDLDGDGTDEKVVFLGEPSPQLDGRVRMQTTLSGSGEEAWGVTDIETTIVNALDPVDADGDGDQELVLYYDDFANGGFPLVFDLREGLLVQAVVDAPELLVRGQVPAPGGGEYYDMVRVHDYWVEDGTLWSSRSVNAYAAGTRTMTLIKPLVTVHDAWTWRLTEDGLLEPVDQGCIRHDIARDSRTPCEADSADDLPAVTEVAAESIGIGESAPVEGGFPFTVRLRAAADPRLVVEVGQGRAFELGLDVVDPRVLTTQPVSVFSDGPSVVLTSASDPGYVRVVHSDGERLRELEPTGEVALTGDASQRTWLTADGTLVTAVAGEGDTWRLWFWQWVGREEMAALPGTTVCFDDPADPATLRHC